MKTSYKSHLLKFSYTISFLLMFSNAHPLYASSINIHVDDVLDLATYADALDYSISVDSLDMKTKSQVTFTTNIAATTTSKKITLFGIVKKIDSTTYYVHLKKSVELSPGNIKEVSSEKLLLDNQTNRKKEYQDVFWFPSNLNSNRDFLRQRTILTYEEN